VGSHAELLASDGLYAALYHQQFHTALEGHAGSTPQIAAA